MDKERYEDWVKSFMEETGCSRLAAEIKVEMMIGSNPDYFYEEEEEE